jgi:hypothetical protein
VKSKFLSTSIASTTLKQHPINCLYGATWFELERPDTTADDKDATQHLLIALFPPDWSLEQINKQIAKLHRHFLRLFHYRNKILWAHEQSVRLKRSLKLATSKISVLTTQLQEGLDEPSLHRFIKTVEGIVGLERTKTERDFNRTLQVAGFGIGSATLVHSSLSSKSDELLIPFWVICA